MQAYIVIFLWIEWSVGMHFKYSFYSSYWVFIQTTLALTKAKDMSTPQKYQSCCSLVKPCASLVAIYRNTFVYSGTLYAWKHAMKTLLDLTPLLNMFWRLFHVTVCIKWFIILLFLNISPLCAYDIMPLLLNFYLFITSVQRKWYMLAFIYINNYKLVSNSLH